MKVTHESFIQAVRDASVAYARGWQAARPTVALTSEQMDRVTGAKLVYGRGDHGLRGVTMFGAWKNGSVDELIEVCALAEESWVQLAGTTIHELAHAAAGFEVEGKRVGHGKLWKQLCAALGMRRAKESGMVYRKINFAPELRHAIEALPKPDDGLPNAGVDALTAFKRRGCLAGLGARGGKSRGAGSGSRQRKYVCDVCGQIIRAGTDDLVATHQHVEGADGHFLLDGPSNKQGAHAGMAAALNALFGNPQPADPEHAVLWQKFSQPRGAQL